MDNNKMDIFQQFIDGSTMNIVCSIQLELIKKNIIFIFWSSENFRESTILYFMRTLHSMSFCWNGATTGQENQ